ncbi:cytosolic sulfotransferase 5 [Quercus suber]|uniref:Sulfotransferase n=1 Tax=Quercus suber TaxID=58331 RepID=A0AAW0KF28_QUESU|nr:cytosolic sulfotransferase 5-like [Quercus suber]POE84753.1 cytosolic sulfotransferase 5 [Quercus suber]
MCTQQPSIPSPPLPKYLKEDEVTQECRNFISSLPTEKGWVANNLHQYQGCWIATRYMQGVLSFQKHFQAHDTDIILVTTPKAGTTWLKALLFSLVNRVHYPNPQKHHPLLTNNPHVLVPFLDINLYTENQVPDLTSFASPRLFSTHLPYVSLPMSTKDSACKIVHLSRNPKDTFVSLWHFTNSLRSPASKGPNSLQEAFDKFCRGVSLYGPYWDHVLGYWKESLENPERVLFLKFEEMKEQPTTHLRKLAEFLGCPLSSEEEAKGVGDDILRLCSFDNLSNVEVNKSGKLSSGEENSKFFRRGEVGDWVNHLTDEMIEKLDRITQEKFRGSGLKF